MYVKHDWRRWGWDYTVPDDDPPKCGKGTFAECVRAIQAAGMLYCVILGVKYAKAEEPQDREKAKGALKNAVIGFVLIFILILALYLLMPAMIKWTNAKAGQTIIP